MPVKRRVAKRRIGEYGKEHERFLTKGYAFFRPPPFGDPLDLDAALAAWDDIGGLILVEWIGNRPGTRPWAWWQFNAPEPRRDDEGELDYLTRLGLLETGELEQVQADAERVADDAVSA